MGYKDDAKELDAMKAKYEDIPVPKQLKFDVKKAIQKGKQENRRRNRFMKIVKPVGITAAAAMAAIVILSNSSQSIAYAMERIPVIGAISRVVTFRTYEDKSGNFEAKVEIPSVEEDDSGQINKSIEEYANEFISMYEADLKASGGEGNYALESDYEVVTDNEKYLVIRVNTLQIMASGTQFVKTFVVDKMTGETVSLLKLLGNDSEKLQAVGENIKAQMREQMAADESVAYFLDSDMPEVDFQGLSGEESFYFNENGELVIAFNEYDVAPGYMGAVEFTIPAAVAGTFF